MIKLLIDAGTDVNAYLENVSGFQQKEVDDEDAKKKYWSIERYLQTLI